VPPRTHDGTRQASFIPSEDKIGMEPSSPSAILLPLLVRDFSETDLAKMDPPETMQLVP